MPLQALLATELSWSFFGNNFILNMCFLPGSCCNNNSTYHPHFCDMFSDRSGMLPFLAQVEQQKQMCGVTRWKSTSHTVSTSRQHSLLQRSQPATANRATVHHCLCHSPAGKLITWATRVQVQPCAAHLLASDGKY